MAIVLMPGCRNLVTSMLMLTGRLSLPILSGIQLAVDTLRSLIYTSTLPVVAIVAEANTGSSCNRICCLNQISEVLSTCWVAIQCVWNDCEWAISAHNIVIASILIFLMNQSSIVLQANALLQSYSRGSACFCLYFIVVILPRFSPTFVCFPFMYTVTVLT